VTADTVVSTIAEDDAERADTTRLVVERRTALYGALTLEQRKYVDRRIIQSLREPLGST
jgi:hypothetical protein